MNLKLAFLTLLACLFAPFSFAQGFHGTWETSFGEIQLFEEYAGSGKENSVYGTYADRGFILAKSNGKTLRGVFLYADQENGEVNKARDQYIGTFEWNLTSDFSKFNGPWQWGTKLPYGSGRGWTGDRVSDATPTLDRSKLRRWSFNFALEAGNDINAWMRAVKDLQGAGYPDPNADPTDYIGSFEISVVSSRDNPDKMPRAPAMNPEKRAATAALRRANPTLHDDCWVIDISGSRLRCDLLPPPNAVDGIAGMTRSIDDSNYPLYKSVHLDFDKCLDGSIRIDGYYLICKSKSYYGSYSNSCDGMEIEAQTDGKFVVVSYCDGPDYRLPVLREWQLLFNEKGKTVYYYKYPTAFEHSI